MKTTYWLLNKIWSISAIYLLLVRSCFSQVNTESLRKSDLSPGFYHTLQFDFAFVAGNSEFLKLKTGFRTDYLIKQYYAFGIVQYQRGLQKNEVFINKGFIHLRGIRRLNQRFSGEIFVQKEFDDFILLKDRNLIGGGLRTAVISSNPDDRICKCFIGNGAMWEKEKIKTNPFIETKKEI